MAERDGRIFHDRPNAHRELLLAAATTPEPATVPLARFGIAHLVHVSIATTRAGGSIAPPLLLHKLDRHAFVAADGWKLCDDFRLGLSNLALAFGHE